MSENVSVPDPREEKRVKVEVAPEAPVEKTTETVTEAPVETTKETVTERPAENNS